MKKPSDITRYWPRKYALKLRAKGAVNEKACVPVKRLGDPVNHPRHYKKYGVEVIRLTENMPFLDGNVVKYVCRAPFKGAHLQDLLKAQWYLRRAIRKAKANAC